jgi:hypothetical protein
VLGVGKVHVSNISLTSVIPRIGHPPFSNTSCSAGRGSHHFIEFGGTGKFNRHMGTSNGDLNSSSLSGYKVWCVNTEVSRCICAGSDM